MSQFAPKVLVWFIAILLLLLGIFLQVRYAQGKSEAGSAGNKVHQSAGAAFFLAGSTC